MVKLFPIMVLLTIGTSACWDRSSAETILVDLTAVDERVLTELKAQSIWYERAGPNTIRVQKADADAVIGVFNESQYQLLKPGLSTAFSERIQPALKALLVQNGVDFRAVCVNGVEFLSWEADDGPQVDALIQQARASQHEGQSSENDAKASFPARCP